MKKEILISLILGMILISSNTFATDKNALTGSWKCTAVDVPDTYRSSTIIITEKEGKLEGKVKFEGGIEISLNYVKQTGKDVIMSIYVEGYEVIINAKQEGSKLTGTADTPDGKVTLSASKEEAKK
jgi:hypothetical protein